MSHLYPLATTAREALDDPSRAARSLPDARRLGDEAGQSVSKLETQWLTLTELETSALEGAAEAGVALGFVQRYENADGATVLAISYWKLIVEGEAELVPTPQQGASEKPEADDHTDDLYFRQGRTKPRRTRKKVDPNQLNLFSDVDE